MIDTLPPHIEARRQRRVEKYSALLPADLAVAMAETQRQLENARTGILNIHDRTPEGLIVRFGLLLALTGGGMHEVKGEEMPARLRDALKLGRVLKGRFAAFPKHLAAVLLDVDTFEDALALAESAVDDLDPGAEDSARDLDRALVEEGLLEGPIPETVAPSPPELKGCPPEVPPFFAELALICREVLDAGQCKILASGSFSWPESPQPPEEVLADRLARLFLKQKKVKDPEDFLAERGYIAPEGRLPL